MSAQAQPVGLVELVELAELADLEGAAGSAALGSRVLAGQLLMLRGGMQAIGLFEELRAASLEGIRSSAGPEVADRVAAEGFESMHRIVDAADIPAITDAVYRVVSRHAPVWLERILRDGLGVSKPFYFEKQPNVRFLVPYDCAKGHGAAYRRFAESHGEGKITPHGPHRDSWLDCPTNAVNVWIAVGPVRAGNGLTIFPEVYARELAHTKKGEITREVNPGTPISFDMAPGDALVFHGDQLHASELNRTDATRHVVSFRLTLDRPHFRNLQYHHYRHSGLQGGALSALAGLPANLSWKYVDTRLRFLGRKLRGAGRDGPAAPRAAASASEPTQVTLDVSELPVGALHPVSSRACATRLEDGRIVAFARTCPHEGADLARGYVRDGHVMCPWHNLRIDLATGESPCSSLRTLRRYPVRVQGDRVTVVLREGEGSRAS